MRGFARRRDEFPLPIVGLDLGRAVVFYCHFALLFGKEPGKVLAWPLPLGSYLPLRATSIGMLWIV